MLPELPWGKLTLTLIILRCVDSLVSSSRRRKAAKDKRPAVEKETSPAKSVSRKKASSSLTPLTEAQLFGLTVALAGVEFVWATQMIFTVPIFERLGLSQRFLGLSWIAGPVSGLFVQPIAGSWSDELESCWGRRRPFLVGGLVCTLLSMAAFAGAEEIGTFLGDTHADKSIALAVAIVSSFGDDIAKNAVQVYHSASTNGSFRFLF